MRTARMQARPWPWSSCRSTIAPDGRISGGWAVGSRQKAVGWGFSPASPSSEVRRLAVEWARAAPSASFEEAPMTREDILSLLADHQEAFLARDAGRLALQHAPAGTFQSPAHGIVEGREAIGEVYRYWFAAFPDLRLTWGRPVVDGDRAGVFWNFSGTAHGPFFGAVGAGSLIEMPGAA